MKTDSKQDFNFLTSVLTILFGIIYGLLTLMTPKASIGNPLAPIYYPIGLSVAMIILGLILLIMSDLSKTKKALKALKYRTDIEKESNKLIIITSVVCVIYALLFERAGFVISTFIFMELMLYLTNGKSKWKMNTIVAVVFSVSIFYIFNNLLSVVLPPIPFL